MIFLFRHTLPLIALASTALPCPGALVGEAPPEPPAAVTPAPAPAPEDPLGRQAWELMKAGKLMTADAFSAEEKAPKPGPVALAAARTKPLSGRELARHAANCYLRVGWFFQCSRCDKWHTNFSGGYAIATDTAVTAHHVMQPPENVKPGTGYAILVRGEAEVLPVTAVLADDATVDAVVLRVGTNDLQPLPFSGDVQVGDSVWCLSDPHGVRNYFSAGIVNRLYVRKGTDDQRERRINVSTDWAPGSSGAAVLDVCGNAVGHVGSIQGFLGNPKASAPNVPAKQPVITEMVLHEAISAKSVLTLINR